MKSAAMYILNIDDGMVQGGVYVSALKVLADRKSQGLRL